MGLPPSLASCHPNPPWYIIHLCPSSGTDRDYLMSDSIANGAPPSPAPPPPTPSLTPRVLKVTRLSDPFDALIEAQGNEQLAADLLGCETVAEFYRRLESADPERFQRGMQAKLMVGMNQLLTTVQGRIIERLEDHENPMTDRTLVDLLTRAIPAMNNMIRPTEKGDASAAEGYQKLLDFFQSLPDSARTDLAGHLDGETIIDG